MTQVSMLTIQKMLFANFELKKNQYYCKRFLKIHYTNTVVGQRTQGGFNR